MTALRILVVDDDPFITLGLTELLAELGHQPVEANSARQALERLATQPFDVVITDETMPGMTGSALAHLIREQWPGVGIVLSSGYADLPDAGPAALARLDKPFRPEQVRAALTKAVEQR